MIRVLLVDDHRLVRASLRRVLDDADGVEVVGEAASGEDAVAAVRAGAPDVVLMDVNMPGIGGLEATRKLHAIAPAVRIIVVSAHTDDPYPRRMLAAGASGYLTKDCEPDEVVEAVRRVAAGETWLDAAIARRIAGAQLAGQGGDSPLQALSPRELQVLMMITQGRTTQDIATTLNLSPKTVATYRYRLYQKLDVGNDVELARLAMRYGIAVDPKVVD